MTTKIPKKSKIGGYEGVRPDDFLTRGGVSPYCTGATTTPRTRVAYQFRKVAKRHSSKKAKGKLIINIDSKKGNERKNRI